MKRQSTDTTAKRQRSVKDFQAAIRKMLQEAIMNTLGTTGNLNKEIENIMFLFLRWTKFKVSKIHARTYILHTHAKPHVSFKNIIWVQL